MATLTNINPPTVKPAAAPLTNAMAAAADEFVAQPNSQYILRFTNGSATPGNIVFDDPTSPNPGDATAFDADVTVALPATPGIRAVTVRTPRFRAADGKVKWTYSANMTNAASLVEIYGPYPL